MPAVTQAGDDQREQEQPECRARYAGAAWPVGAFGGRFGPGARRLASGALAFGALRLARAGWLARLGPPVARARLWAAESLGPDWRAVCAHAVVVSFMRDGRCVRGPDCRHRVSRPGHAPACAGRFAASDSASMTRKTASQTRRSGAPRRAAVTVAFTAEEAATPVLSADEQLHIITSGIAALVPEADMAKKLAEGQAAAREARRRPDRARPAPRPRGAAAQAAPVPGPRAHGRPHHRRLHRAHRRSVGPQHDAPAAHARADRRERGRPTWSRRSRSSIPTRPSCAATPSGSTSSTSRTCSSSRASSRSRASSSATTSRSATRRSSRISLHEFLYPDGAGLRLGGDRGRRRAGRHRPAVQPAGRSRTDGEARAWSRRCASRCRCSRAPTASRR